MSTKPGLLLKADQIAAAPEVHFRHPLNPNSDIYLRPLAEVAGFERLGLSIGRVPPGRDSFVYHSHERDEEFLYILSGRGRIDIDGTVSDVGPGDFMGFPTPSVGHHLSNPFEEDLVYLMGGERSMGDIGHFPRHGKKALKIGTGFFFVDDDAIEPLDMEKAFPDGLPGRD